MSINNLSEDVLIAEEVVVGGNTVNVKNPPPPLRFSEELGLLTDARVTGRLVHQTAAPEVPLFETRATLTPGGDYLLMFPDGGHYGRADAKLNEMLAYRSRDKGGTWEGPSHPFDIDYNQHGFIPFIPRGSDRLYAFGTQPIWGKYSREDGLAENTPIGYRFSDDDGVTWSDVTLIEPVNDPGFLGMSVMRMCETESGAWLLGSHEADWSRKPLITRQYVLRSEDRGRSWEVLPGRRHDGWQCPGFNRMDEGRPIELGGRRVLLMTRTPEGHLWALRSEDDGKTWSDPDPTPLIHPDAPPMLFKLSDGHTLAAFHHNRHHDLNYTGLSSAKPELMMDRSEIWVSLSEDEGASWTEPRFVFVNALAEYFDTPFRNYQCSYIDGFPDEGVMNLFVPHRWRRVLHLRIAEKDLRQLATADELR
jgi:hypothetical protein